MPAIDKKEAYTVIQEQLKIVEQYLADKKITTIEQKTINGYYNYKRDLKTGAYTNIPESYNLSQPITIASNNVELIKDIFELKEENMIIHQKRQRQLMPLNKRKDIHILMINLTKKEYFLLI